MKFLDQFEDIYKKYSKDLYTIYNSLRKYYGKNFT